MSQKITEPIKNRFKNESMQSKFKLFRIRKYYQLIEIDDVAHTRSQKTQNITIAFIVKLQNSIQISMKNTHNYFVRADEAQNTR